MSDITHRALLVLDLQCENVDAARDAVDQAVNFAAGHPDVVAIEASPPVPFRGEKLATGEEAGADVVLDGADAAAAGAVIRAYLRSHDALLELGHVSVALPHRNKLEELAERLDGGAEVLPLFQAPGQVYQMHRGSLA